MEFILVTLVEFILHIDKHLATITQTYGAWTYVILFLIIFCETGLVVTPFLPGDSLLFATGALAAIGALEYSVLFPVLIIAVIIGDNVNYWNGYFWGSKVVENDKFPLIKRSHIEKTQAFYDKHGGKTIILARYIPIVRTFAPFVAGIGKMHYPKFLAYSIGGGITWVTLFTAAGYFFGNLPAVKHNFTLVIFGIILVSIMPPVYEYLKSRFAKAEVKSG